MIRVAIILALIFTMIGGCNMQGQWNGKPWASSCTGIKVDK